MLVKLIFSIALFATLCASTPQAGAQLYLVPGLSSLLSPKSSQSAAATEPASGSTAVNGTMAAKSAAAAPDTLGRDTPRGTAAGFLAADSKGDWDMAAAYLDLSYLPKARQKKQGPELARQLQTLLNQGGWIMATAMISDAPAGKPDDGLDPDLERIGSLKTGRHDVGLVLERVKQPDGAQIWLISSSTMQDVPALIDDIRPSRINRLLPASLTTEKLWGVPVGHWLALGVLAVLAYLIAWGLTTLGRTIAHRTAHRINFDNLHLFHALELPARLYIAVWLFTYAGRFMDISALARQYFSPLTVIVGWISVMLFFWHLIDIVADRAQQHMSRNGRMAMFSVIAFARRSAKFIFIAMALIVILGMLGVDVRTGIAALGIGGIALALGAQKTVENFVGSLMLVFDQPVRLGDYCQIGDVAGTVEDIGMRSTRLRTSARTVVTIPNGDFSSRQIENFSHRDRFLFNPTLRLRYETTPDQIRYLLVTLRETLYAHPKVSPDPARVRFTTIDSYALNLDFYAYIMAADYNEFLEVQEDLLLRIMDIVGEAGTSIAFPSQTIYHLADAPAQKDKADKAGEKVRQWQTENDLQLPRFSADRIENVQDSITYPPKGSAVGKN